MCSGRENEPKTNRKFELFCTICSFVRLLVRSNSIPILDRADAIDLVHKSSNFKPSSRFLLGRLKILNSKQRRNARKQCRNARKRCRNDRKRCGNHRKRRTTKNDTETTENSSLLKLQVLNVVAIERLIERSIKQLIDHCTPSRGLHLQLLSSSPSL